MTPPAVCVNGHFASVAICSLLWSVGRRHHLRHPTLGPGPPVHRSRLRQAVSRDRRLAVHGLGGRRVRQRSVSLNSPATRPRRPPSCRGSSIPSGSFLPSRILLATFGG